ncbi:hypothetical protein Bbelb_084410 [Branchiostoma belcheri]|nr:hypothetical protein Bbelb_084410 [Branchiostoma belcheri]
MVTWIHSYLGGRCERVVVNWVASSWKEPTPGVPQGIVLYPSVFLLFMASRTIPHPDTMNVGYADGVSMSRAILPIKTNTRGSICTLGLLSKGLGFILDKNLTLQEQVTSMYGHVLLVGCSKERSARWSGSNGELYASSAERTTHPAVQTRGCCRETLYTNAPGRPTPT